MTKQGILKPDLEKAVLSLTETCGEIYLVGGAIRDHLLGIECRDIDFVVRENAVIGARKLANALNGKFYVLDAERGTGRVLLPAGNGKLVVDFATMIGDDIQDDLKARDFTMNAIALNITRPDKWIDPLQGEQDLRRGCLKPCSPQSFNADPVRVIRAVRFEMLFNLQIEKATQELIRSAARLLKEVSVERKRDEIFHVFECGRIADACALLRDYRIWNEVFPCLERIEGDLFFQPHVHNLIDHTLQVMNYCECFLQSIRSGKVDAENSRLRSGCENLLEFRKELLEFLDQPIHPQRQYDGLAYLGILYHDIGKTVLMQDGSSNFDQHAAASADFFHKIADNWALSNDEVDFIERFIRNHSIQYPINDLPDADSKLVIYGFFRQAGTAGVLLAIFYQADILSAYEDTVTEERWQKALQTSHTLLDCWFNHYNEIIDPPRILDGDEIMREFNVRPGKIVGEILESVREAQASGKVRTRDEALAYARAATRSQEKKTDE